MKSVKASQSKSIIYLQRLVWFAFLIALIVLLVSLGTITGIMIVRPPCTVTGTVCADGWSVAGLAAAILGVGGTMITVIGGLAVAAWWVKLEERVEEQVRNQVSGTLATELEKKLEPIRDELSHHQKALDDISTELENFKIEVDFLHRQLEGVLQLAMYTTFPKYMELDDFDLSNLEAFMKTISASAPLVNAKVCQAVLARFWVVLDLELKELVIKDEADQAVINRKLKIGLMLDEFRHFSGKFIFPFTDDILGMSKKYFQREVSELDRIGKDIDDQIAKRSPDISQKISISDEIAARLRKAAVQEGQES